MGFTAYHVRTSGEYNPATGSIVEVLKTIPVRAIILDLTLQSNGLTTKPHTEIVAGDKQLYIQPPAQGLVINPSTDKIRVGTTDYDIVTTKELNPDSTVPLLYELYLRR
jgi:hypothetical protein